VLLKRGRKKEKETKSAADFIAFVLKIREQKLLETFSKTLCGRGASQMLFGLIWLV